MKNLKGNIFYTLILSITFLTFQSCSDDDDDSCQMQYQGKTTELTKVQDDHYKVYTDIVIDANIETVWGVLTDFDNMPNWSTSFQGLTGDITDGGQVVATFLLVDAMGNSTPLEFPHKLSYIEGEQFSWSDPLTIFPGISDNHLYKLEVLSECQTRFIQTDEFKGTDPGIATDAIAQATEQGYNQFNAQLKNEVEK